MIPSLDDLGCVLLLPSLTDGGAQALTMSVSAWVAFSQEGKSSEKMPPSFPKGKGSGL